MNNLTLVLGGPGCGKTTRLLQIVTHALATGLPPERIAFVAFTRAAAAEAKSRAVALGIDETRLMWFRTIHSLAYQCLGLSREEVMDRRDWKEFSRIIGEPINERNRATLERYAGNSSRGDLMLRVIDYAATTMLPLREVHAMLGEGLGWHEVKRFDDALRSYKASVSKLDFSDMVLSYVNDGEPLNIDLAIVDEAQDLTTSQWKLVERAFSRAKMVYVGGDDDQAIYRWAGANVKYFLSLEEAQQEVLPISHRLPPRIHEYSRRIVRRIRARYEKNFAPRQDGQGDGKVEWHQSPSDIMTEVKRPHYSWLLLARNGYLLQSWEETLRAEGIPYSNREGNAIREDERDGIILWGGISARSEAMMNATQIRSLATLCEVPRPSLREFGRYRVGDFLPVQLPWYRAFTSIPQPRVEYYTNCLMRGTFTDPSRIRVETIHGVKGAEADRVALMTDISWRTAEALAWDPDTEHRVFYVGVTRARGELHLVAPQGATCYDLPH